MLSTEKPKVAAKSSMDWKVAEVDLFKCVLARHAPVKVDYQGLEQDMRALGYASKRAFICFFAISPSPSHIHFSSNPLSLSTLSTFHPCPLPSSPFPTPTIPTTPSPHTPSSPPCTAQLNCTAKAITHRIQKIKSASPPSTTDPDAATPASSPTKAVASKKPRASPTKKATATATANGKGKAAAAKGKATKRKHEEMEDGSDVTEGEGKGDKKMKVKEEDEEDADVDADADTEI
ncbi:MAG: hypothetical protein L6R36_004012 [Xanthoria steineri]|nr:MAG: hypothetical protein L6R36_004012 [Xanthoria steineri]